MLAWVNSAALWERVQPSGQVTALSITTGREYYYVLKHTAQSIMENLLHRLNVGVNSYKQLKGDFYQFSKVMLN